MKIPLVARLLASLLLVLAAAPANAGIELDSYRWGDRSPILERSCKGFTIHRHTGRLDTACNALADGQSDTRISAGYDLHYLLGCAKNPVDDSWYLVWTVPANFPGRIFDYRLDVDSATGNLLLQARCKPPGCVASPHSTLVLNEGLKQEFGALYRNF